MNKNIVSVIVNKYPAVVPYLKGQAALTYCEVKAMQRDPKEPGLEEKTAKENKLDRILRRRFSRQQAEVIQWIEDNKAGWFLFSAAKTDPETAELIVIFYESIVKGTAIAQQQTGVVLDDAIIHAMALEFAKSYVADWLRGLDATSLNAVQNAISLFITTPGTTIGDVARLLAPTFGEDRAWRIAVTEITRAFAEANNIYAKELAVQYPGFKVQRKWFTNNDDRVCPICGALDGEIVDERTDWTANGMFIQSPPAHVNCRCWIGVTVKA